MTTTKTTTRIARKGIHVHGWFGRNPRTYHGSTFVGRGLCFDSFTYGRVVGPVAKVAR